MSRFACPGRSSASSAWSPVDGLHPMPSQRFTTIGEHPQRLELAVELKHSQGADTDRDDRDRVRAAGVGRTVVTGVEQSDSGGELGRDVDDAVLEQPLGQGPPRAVCARQSCKGRVQPIDATGPPKAAGFSRHRAGLGLRLLITTPFDVPEGDVHPARGSGCVLACWGGAGCTGGRRGRV